MILKMFERRKNNLHGKNRSMWLSSKFEDLKNKIRNITTLLKNIAETPKDFSFITHATRPIEIKT
jgi:hypothetical protein